MHDKQSTSQSQVVKRPKSNTGTQIIPHSNIPSLPTNPNKSLPSNTTNPLKIKLLNHSPKLLLLQPRLSQLPRNTPQILQINKSLLPLIEELERAKDLVTRIPLQDLQRRHGLERGERHEQVGWVLGVRDGAFIRGLGLGYAVLIAGLLLLLLDLRAGDAVCCEQGD